MSARHWLLELAIAAFPQRALAADTQLPESASEQWLLIAAQAGVTPEELAQQVATHYGLKTLSLRRVDPSLATLLPERMARQYGILPIALSDSTLSLAISNPNDTEAISQVGFKTGRRVECVIVAPDDIDSGITRMYAPTATHGSADGVHLLDLDDASIDLAPSDKTSVPRLCRALLNQAITRRASDIHLHPFAGGGVVRFRVDGVLLRVTTLPSELLASVLRFFKSQGQMDPTNALIPQDGRASLTLNKQPYDLRISTLPASGGESLVIRILDQSRVYSIEQANFASADRMALRRISASANGLFLLTGPTGSGKTSTLYGLLASLNNVSRRIITVEEPVEYQLPGITQVEVNAQTGLSFAAALRAILRQDPDILLVGEIRDEETAAIAVNAALTGHLVFSTLHTMDAMRAIPRLIELGIRPAVLADTLLGVMSQRLMRKLCPHCRTPLKAPLAPLEKLFREITDESPAYRAAGCSECNYTGYKGRLPVTEIIEVDDKLRSVFLAHNIDNDTLEHALPAGWQGIHTSAANWIVSGDSTPEEAHANLGIGFWTALSRQHQRTAAIQEAVAQAGASGGGSLSVIVVTADEAAGNEIVATLDTAGYRSHREATGADARPVLEANGDVQLLIVDSTGGESAEALLRELRSELAWSGLPVILLTNPADTDFQALLDAHGGADTLPKPVTPEALLARVEARLRR